MVTNPLTQDSLRAVLLAGFVFCALVLGGGGSPNPLTELVLQILFAGYAAWWLFAQQEAGQPHGVDRTLVFALLLVLAVPVLQLVPLPPAIWTALPGREAALESLGLAGAAESWRPLSLTPYSTLAALLAMIPPVCVAFAMSRLSARRQRLVLAAVVGIGLLTALLGVLQVAAGDTRLNFYEASHRGWVTGFQANRNAAADVLLVAFLALALLARPYLLPESSAKGILSRKSSVFAAVGALALVLFAAIIMTGSRAGMALLVPTLLFATAILFVGPGTAPTLPKGRTMLIGIATMFGLSAVLLWLAIDGGAYARLAGRLGAIGSDIRPELWEDTWFAIKTYWPAGFGLGGFETAILPAEQLTFLDITRPNRAHNDYLELALEAGLPGLAVLLVVALALATIGVRSWRKAEENRPSLTFSLGTFCVLLLHSVVDYPLRSMAVAVLVAIATGMLSATSQNARHTSAT